ncbi:MAG: hypothetical protein PHI12_06395, partial [Dehalococcoidales bacterium]|nr:hypothetical protein [Dehalococcoidales bacterium]
MKFPVDLAESSGALFTLKEVTWTPEIPKKNDAFTVEGKVELFGIPLLVPVWVIVSVTYPEEWWEIIGSPAEYKTAMTWLGNFKVTFDKGFSRDGEYKLEVSAYAGPTTTVSIISSKSVTLPPFPSLTKLTEQTFSVSSEEAGFAISQPTATPNSVMPGNTVTIKCTVTSGYSTAQSVTAKVYIYEGSALAGHGTLLTTKTVNFNIEPGASHDIVVTDTAVAGSIDRRDVGVELFIGGTSIASDEWDDVFNVQQVSEGFTLSQPTASPVNVVAGSAVTLTCPVKSNYDTAKSVTAKVYIYEGSALAGHGTLLTTKTVNFSIAPGATYNVVVTDTAVSGSIDRRDIGVELFVGGTSIASDEWDDVFYVTSAPVVAFTLGQPSASPGQVAPGSAVTITCPVSSQSSASQSVTAKVYIYEGSALAGHGTLLATKTVNFSVAPGSTYNVVVTDTAVAGSIDRRDIGVELFVGGTSITSDEWDDVFYVTSAPVVAFTLGQPSASPGQVAPGSAVTITCPVSSQSSATQSVTAKVYIYEGSILSGHGTLLTTKTVNFSIAPGATYNVVVTDTAVAGSIDRRDIGVELFVGGTSIASDEWDDVFYVTSGGQGTLSGSIHGGIIYYEGLGLWKQIESGLQVPMDKAISLAIGWINTSDVSEIGHIDLTIDGFIPISAIEKQDTEAEPGDGWYILFSDFVFSG